MGSQPLKKRGYARSALVVASALYLAACSTPFTSSTSSDTNASSPAGYQSVVSAVSPSIVLIESSGGLGSGVVFDSSGDIATNAHVLGSATSFRITTADGKMFPASLVGSYPPSDIAVIRASGANLRAAHWADSRRLKVGQIVLAMGNPLGLQSSVSDGVVSAVGRTVTSPDGSVIPNMVQTSAAINPGNSGGGLVNLQSEVIGMPTLGAIDPRIGSAVPGIGFALSSDTVTDFANQIIKNGKVVNTRRAYLGVQLGDLTGAVGVVVLGVAPSGPAAAGGVVVGDIITSIDGKPTPSTPMMAEALAQLTPGETASLNIKRGGAEMTVKVTLGELPT